MVRVADVATASPTGRTRHVVRNEDAQGIVNLAVAAYDGDPGFYLFYCDHAWRVVTDTYHDTERQAIDQARFEFGPIDFVDP